MHPFLSDIFLSDVFAVVLLLHAYVLFFLSLSSYILSPIKKQNIIIFLIYSHRVNMSTSKERVFVTGATGSIGSGVVRGLIKNGIETTAYVRDEQKSKDLFKDELKTGHLTITVGDYTTVDAYKKAIQGHIRLFLLVVPKGNNPTTMSQIKHTFGKIAFEQGVRQIVDLSSCLCEHSMAETGIIGYMHTSAEEKLWTLADDRSSTTFT